MSTDLQADVPVSAPRTGPSARKGRAAAMNTSPHDFLQMAQWCGGRWSHPPKDPIAGVSIDSRQIRPGELFVALPGENADGHAFLDAARARGAAGAVVRRGTPDRGWPLLAVEDPRRALGDLARGHRGRLTGRIVAVTGSSGKTSVKELVANLLATEGSTARTRGNWNNDLGMPLSLLAMAPADRFGVFEIGMNHPGELDPLCAILQPHMAVVTGVGPVHIEHFESEEDIAREKAAPLRALPPDGLAVLPMDDPWFPVLRGEWAGALRTVSLTAGSDYLVRPGAGLRFAVTERSTGETVNLDAPLPGRHVLSNCGLAIAVARACGVSWVAIEDRIRTYRPPAMRWESTERDGVHYINDAYNANPMSMRAALDGFASMPVAGRRWVVLGAMLELGARAEAEHEAVGRLAGTGPWAGLIAVGPEGAWLCRGARNAGALRIITASDVASARALLKDLIRPGDAVLLKASRGVALERLLDGL